MTSPSRTAIVTGAAGALGQAVVRRFDEQGWRVACLDRSEERLETVFGGTTHWRAAADVTCEAAAGEAIAGFVQGGGPVHALVHAAGGFEMGEAAHGITRGSWERMMALNAWSFVAVTRPVVPLMLRQGHGSIVAVSAASAARGHARMAAYAASKSALQRLVEALSAEVRARGVHVNSVAPTTLDTPANRAAMPGADPSAWVPLDAAAAAIVALASAPGGAVHGQHLQLGA